MRTKIFLISAIFFAGSSAFAATGGIMRGGLGFLFPDHNSFSNEGQFAASRGIGIQASYTKTDVVDLHALGPSFVYGNGNVGFGVYGSRFGTDISDSTGDTIGAGLGLALFKGRATIGVGYGAAMSSMGNGNLDLTLTMNPANHKGASLGVGYTMGIGGGTSALIAGLGYSFDSNANFEVNFRLPSISDFSSWNLEAYFTTMKSILYLGGGYIMSNAAGSMSHTASGRLGFILGRSVDLSFIIGKTFATPGPMTLGGTFRVSF